MSTPRKRPAGPHPLTRRALLAAFGAGAAGITLAACSSRDSAPLVTTPPDRSKSEKKLTWANWPFYLDVNEETGERPTLQKFTQATGVTVEYKEDVNTNNGFSAEFREKLDAGETPSYDVVIITDWNASDWIVDGLAAPLDKANIPNASNVLPALANPAYDPGNKYTLPWTSGFAALGWNKEKLKKHLGTDTMTSVDQLFDPRLKGRVTVLGEYRDTMNVILSWLGYDPSNFTDDQYAEGIAVLTRYVDSGQIRQVTGNDYTGALLSGEIDACLGWSGDFLQLGDRFGLALPETGGGLWTDTMLIPATSAHKASAEALLNHYYDPQIAAEVAEYIQFMCPVAGADAAMKALDPELMNNPWVFPTPELLANAKQFMTVSRAKNDEYQKMFTTAIGEF